MFVHVFLSETNPCSPSPCNYNGECRVKNGVAVCIYPECVINTDCPRDKACFSQKCRDPCIGACGINSLCQTVNHKPVCSCPVGFTGNARVQCTIPTLPGERLCMSVNIIILNIITVKVKLRSKGQSQSIFLTIFWEFLFETFRVIFKMTTCQKRLIPQTSQ